MNLSMPPMFPQKIFREFGRLAVKLFPAILSNEYFDDPLQKRQHFDLARLAVCYRYRACSEYNDAFKALIANASEYWHEWGSDEEQNYKIEQSLYQFFMNGLSVFDSLGFCLYFVGSMVCPKHFLSVSNSKQITLAATCSEFTAAFPYASLTNHLAELSKDTEFSKIKKIRNIIAHRLTGMRYIHGYGITLPDGTHTYTREEGWYVSDLDEKLIFDEELIQRQFNAVTRLLTTIISAALTFVKEGVSP